MMAPTPQPHGPHCRRRRLCVYAINTVWGRPERAALLCLHVTGDQRTYIHGCGRWDPGWVSSRRVGGSEIPPAGSEIHVPPTMTKKINTRFSQEILLYDIFIIATFYLISSLQVYILGGVLAIYLWMCLCRIPMSHSRVPTQCYSPCLVSIYVGFCPLLIFTPFQQ